MAALFGQGSNNGRREPKSLVEFRAGKMTLKGTTVTADTRKGLVYMKLMEDQLLHFYWKDRSTGEVVDDLIIFSGDAEMKRVTECTTGRVVLLKFHGVGRNYFYWLQEPKEDKDEDYLQKVNELIENPQAAAAAAASDSMPGFPQGLMANPHLQSLFGPNASPQLMEQLISSGMFQQLEGSRAGRGASSSVAPATASPPPTSTGQSQQLTPARPQPETTSQARVVQLGDLQDILSSMTLPGTEQEGGGASASQEPPIQLSDVVTPDVLRPLANSPGVEEEISPHLPPTDEGAEAILTSPQFQQALGVFGSALGSGQLGPLMDQFGLGGGVSAAANSGDVRQFAQALQSEFKAAETDQSEESPAEKKDGADKEPDPPAN